MKKVVFTKAEIKEIQKSAEAHVKESHGENWDVYKIDAEKKRRHESLLREKSGDNSLCFVNGCTDLIYGDRVSPCLPKVGRIVTSETGFSPDDYENLTGKVLPFSGVNVLYKEVDGKVYKLPESGDLSSYKGASDYLIKDRVLVTQLVAMTDWKIEVE